MRWAKVRLFKVRMLQCNGAVFVYNAKVVYLPNLHSKTDSTAHDFPEETDLGRNNDELYIGGGLTKDISVLEFELYALFFD